MPNPNQSLPVADLDEPGEPIAYVTIDQVAAICREVTRAKPMGVVAYEPTFPQVFFFTLVRATKVISKKRGAEQVNQAEWWQTPAPCLRLPSSTVKTIAQNAAQHLADWGATVHGLQQRNAQEWELLRIQMEYALKRFPHDLATKDDALHDALLKVFAVLTALPESQRFQTAPNLFAFFVEQQATMSGVYDFSSPFYAYTQLIARNTLFYQLRRNNLEPLYPVAWDDLPTEPAEEDQYPFETEEKAREEEAQLLQLRIDLARLFDLVEIEMQSQKKRRLVIWHTLAARSQYWLSLTLTALTPPVLLSPTPQASDTDIAHTLGMSENTVRVHRRQAKIQIDELDAVCGTLLTTLMDIDQSNDLQWWPRNS